MYVNYQMINFIPFVSYVQLVQSFTLDMVELMINFMNSLIHAYAYCWLTFRSSLWQYDLLSFSLLSGTWNFSGLGECWAWFCYHFWHYNNTFKCIFYYLPCILCDADCYLALGKNEFDVYATLVINIIFTTLLTYISII